MSKYSWKKVELTDTAIADQLANAARNGDTIHIMKSSTFRGGRTHLVAHRAADGRYYVRYGRRGSGKRYVTSAELTLVDGRVLLTQFILD